MHCASLSPPPPPAPAAASGTAASWHDPGPHPPHVLLPGSRRAGGLSRLKRCRWWEGHVRPEWPLSRIRRQREFQGSPPWPCGLPAGPTAPGLLPGKGRTRVPAHTGSAAMPPLSPRLAEMLFRKNRDGPPLTQSHVTRRSHMSSPPLRARTQLHTCRVVCGEKHAWEGRTH